MKEKSFFSRSNTWFVYIQFLISSSSPLKVIQIMFIAKCLFLKVVVIFDLDKNSSFSEQNKQRKRKTSHFSFITHFGSWSLLMPFRFFTLEVEISITPPFSDVKGIDMVLIHFSDVKGIDMISICIDTCRYRKVSIPS